MKFASVLALLAAVVVVSAETNGERFARGLTPKKPTRRNVAERSTPSLSANTNQCNTGEMHCCNSVSQAGSNGELDDLLGLLGVVVAAGTNVGQSCSPIAALGNSGCTAKPVCCENNQFNGLVNIGCTPIQL